jgi:para-nitrobenzyl esterase
MTNNFNIDRRTLLQGSLWTGAAALGASLLPAVSRSAEPGPIIQTRDGKVRGAVVDGISVFKGIAYGASTSGPNRFQPPLHPQPWTGVRDAIAVGPRAPQVGATGGSARPQPVQSEDCLVLNVWTPEPDKSNKRPVMVWIHGGGFQIGEGCDPNTEGVNLARSGDVVVVSMNHRLNVFGFLYLAEFDKKFQDSGNAGMLDLIAALHWVQENIEAFGGDPTRVMIFGESGGAGKVSALTAMPAARGLFHRAVCESGAMPRNLGRDEATQIARKFLAAVGAREDQVETLQGMPAAQLLDGYNKITKAPFTRDSRMLWQPVVDGRTLFAQPYDTQAPDCSTAVPMIVGTNKTEMSLFFRPDSVNGDNLNTRVAEALRLNDEKARMLVESYRSRRTSDSPYDLFVAIISDGVFRRSSIAVAETKASQRRAPVYMYLLSWETNHLGLRTPHSLDVPLIFRNLDPAGLAGTADNRFAMSDKMSKAWIAFAHSGSPNHDALPQWMPYTTAERATMVFDNECKVVDDPFRDDRLSFNGLPPFDL